MGHRHAFGLACAAGGVNNIGQLFRLNCRMKCRLIMKQRGRFQVPCFQGSGFQGSGFQGSGFLPHYLINTDH